MKYLVLLVLVLGLDAKEFFISPKDAPVKIKKICKLAHGGDTIFLKTGIYTKRFPKITCKGTKNAPVVITAQKGALVTIETPWKIQGNYLVVQNLNFRGMNDTLSYEKVIKQWWKPSKKLHQIALSLTGHHITIRNNAFGYFTASGIKVRGKSDYISIDHNIIYNNSWWTTGGMGGLVIKTIHQIDNTTTDKIKITNNLFFGNESRIFSHVFAKGFSKLIIDEGESFLLQQKEDASKKGAINGKYEGRFLVKNNLILYNGKGSSLNKVDRVDFVQNYLYCNGTTANNKAAGGIRGKYTNYDNFLHNYVSSCKDKLAISIKGEHNRFEDNIVKSTTQKPMPGVKMVAKVFNDPENLDFNPEANRLLSSFEPMLERFAIEIKPTRYKVNKQKQIEDIIRLIPKKADTIVKRYENRVEIINIDNKGLKGMGKNFVLKF